LQFANPFFSKTVDFLSNSRRRRAKILQSSAVFKQQSALPTKTNFLIEITVKNALYSAEISPPSFSTPRFPLQ
jgi:hypothetical protein